MAHTHEFPASEDIEDNIHDDDNIESVTYNGDAEIVECSEGTEGEEEEQYTREGLEEMDRSEVYEVANEVGADPDWSGEDADDKETMVVKIFEALEE